MATILGDAFDRQIDLVIRHASDRNASLSSSSRQLLAEWNGLIRSVVGIFEQLEIAKREAVLSARASNAANDAARSELVAAYTKMIECSRALLAGSEEFRPLLDVDKLASLEKYQRTAVGFLDAEQIVDAQDDVKLLGPDAERIKDLLRS